MKLNGREKLTQFMGEKQDSRNSIKSWVTVIEAANWKNSVEMKAVYQSANIVGSCTVFNIRTNKYRLIAAISYKLQVIEVLHILTHTDYDKDKWKSDCDC